MKIKNFNANKIVICAGISASLVAATSFLTSWASVTRSNDNFRLNNTNTAYALEQVEQFKKQSIEKLASQIKNLGSGYLGKITSEINIIIEKQIGIYNKNTNLSDFIIDLSAPTQEELSNAYNAILSENQKLQLDVMDWYDFNHNAIPQLSQQLNVDLTNQGYFDTKAEQISSEMEGFLRTSIASFGEKYYYSSFDAASSIILNFTSKYTTNDVSKTDQLLAIANDYLKTHQTSFFFVNDEFDISNLLAIYSKDGNVGYNLNDEINLGDLQNFFKYSYDPIYGSILTKPQVDYTSVSGADEEDYDFSLRVTESLKAHTFNNGASYYDGEFLPGYTLHARIVSLDADTDSHKCTIRFQFGVQSTFHDPYGEYILWQELPKLFDADNVNYDALPTYVYDIKSEESIWNISNNVYYQNVESVLADDYLVESETYFNTTSDQREYLDNVLAGVPVDPSTHQYVLSNKNPLYLDPNAINLDGISKPKQWEPNKFMHTNQQYRLKVIEANTNLSGTEVHAESLKAQWVIVDVINENKLLEVVSLPWEINSKTQDDAIWIRFNISEEVKFKLILADAFLGIIDILNTSISLTNSVFDSINNVGEYINIASNLIIAQTVVSALSAVVSAIYPNSNCNCNDK